MLDETAYETKIGTDYWLHGAMSKTASSLTGVGSSCLLDKHPEGLSLFSNSVIKKGDIYHLQDYITPNIDIVVAGELIEHLNDPLSFLSKPKEYECLKQKTIVITTPNACSLHNVILGLFGRESTHKDHLHIFSYKSLNTLCTRSGFENWSILPCFTEYTEMILNTHGYKKLITILFEKFTNALQWLFPLLGGWWIVIIEI